MKLTPPDKAFLEQIGHSSADIQEIMYAIKRTTYTLITERGEEALTEDDAVNILGREGWLRGIGVSTFSITSIRYGLNDEKVKFFSKVYV